MYGPTFPITRDPHNPKQLFRVAHHLLCLRRNKHSVIPKINTAMASDDTMVQAFVCYKHAPLQLHRIRNDLTYYPPSCTVDSHLSAHGSRDVVTRQAGGVETQLVVPTHGCFMACDDLRNVRGVSMLAQRDGHCITAAHDLMCGGKRVPCMVLSSGAPAPDGTAFVHDRVWPQKQAPALHFTLTPTRDVPINVLQHMANPPASVDAAVWQACPIAAAEGALQYEHPSVLSDGLLAAAVFALERFALDEAQPVELRRDARLYQYSLCHAHEDDGANDWSWVCEQRDRRLFGILAGAFALEPRPDDGYFRVAEAGYLDAMDEIAEEEAAAKKLGENADATI